MTRKGVGG